MQTLPDRQGILPARTIARYCEEGLIRLRMQEVAPLARGSPPPAGGQSSAGGPPTLDEARRAGVELAGTLTGCAPGPHRQPAATATLKHDLQ